MKRGTLALIACAALASVAGCGSSSKVPAGSSAGPGAGGPGVGGAGAESAAGSGVFGEPGEKTQTTPSVLVHPTGPVAQVLYHNVAIAPAKLTVKAGTTIVWTNQDSIEHNVKSTSGPARIGSKNLEEGQSFTFVARRPGTIRYECTIHPEKMKGTIRVVR